MNDSSIKDYFRTYPTLTECFETYDGILFPTEDAADAWVSDRSDKTVTMHSKADFINEETEAVEHTVTKADLASASSVAETFGKKEGETVLLQP